MDVCEFCGDEIPTDMAEQREDEFCSDFCEAAWNAENDGVEIRL